MWFGVLYRTGRTRNVTCTGASEARRGEPRRQQCKTLKVKGTVLEQTRFCSWREGAGTVVSGVRATAVLDLKSTVCCWLRVLTVPALTVGEGHVQRRLSWCPAMHADSSCPLQRFSPARWEGFSFPPFFFKWQDRKLGLYLHVCEDSETHGAQIQLVGNSPRQPPFAVHVSSSEETGRADCNSSLTVLLSRDESLVRQGRKGKRGNGAVARTCAAHTTLTN